MFAALRDLIQFFETPTRLRMRSPDPLPNPRVRTFQHLDPLLPSGQRGIETHAHQCPECTHVWRHSNDTVRQGSRAFYLAHTCPICHVGYSTWKL